MLPNGGSVAFLMEGVKRNIAVYSSYHCMLWELNWRAYRFGNLFSFWRLWKKL